MNLQQRALSNMFQVFIVTSCLITLAIVAAEPPHFRILAPEFVCPKHDETGPVKTDNTIITIRTKAGAKLDMCWTVRWTPLPAPTQRFTLLLWRATRALEKKLNAPQKEPYVYVIENDELLPGVDYKFNITASNTDGEETTKTFHINNVKGDQLLENLEGRTDMMSIMLVGGQETYADVEFSLEALVTTCYPTQDYYFVWSAESPGHKVDASPGSRLELPAYLLSAGLTYLVTCQVVSHSTGDFITQTSLPLTVLPRTFEAYLSVDYLTVSIETAFTLESIVLSHDYFDQSLTYQWTCTHQDKGCDFFESTDSDTLYFENGLPNAGRFEVTLTVNANNHSAAASAVLIAVEHVSPVIQITPQPRLLNEGSKITLVANASNVTPTCSLTWYFASEEYLQSQGHVLNDTCEDCQHGEPLTETLTIYSLEENFLYYLTDFSNETEWRQVTAEMQAAAGRARFVVRCDCTQVLDCGSEGTVYADVFFKLNGVPKANVMITPKTGTALETLFRISTLAVLDTDVPLYYTFRCRVGVNSTLVLGTYADHLAVETFLPYMEDGVEVWVEVCDVLGACSRGASKVVDLLTGDGSTVGELLTNAHAHVRRCELIQLHRVGVAGVVTYKNADQIEALTKFCADLLSALPTAEEDHCLKTNTDHYQAFLEELTETGCDATRLMIPGTN